MRQTMHFIRRFRCFLSMIFNCFFPKNVFFCLRIMFSLGRFKSALILIKGNIQSVSFMFRPINIFLRTRFLRICKVMKIIMSDNRNTRLIRAFGRRAFHVRVNRSRESNGIDRTPFLSPIFCYFSRDKKCFEIIGRICPPRASILTAPFLINAIISGNNCASCSLIVLMYRGVVYFARFRYYVLALIGYVRRVIMGIKSKMQVTLMRSMVRASGFLGFSLYESFLSYGDRVSCL